MNSLDWVRLRLTRADCHLRQLVVDVTTFLSEEPYRAVSENNPETGEYVARAVVHRQPPPEFGLLAGDCIHNLRSALDHLAYQLTMRMTNSAPDRVGFPILLNPPKKSFADATSRQIGGLPEAVRLVIEDMQPYKRGDDPQTDLLWILHDLWNTDKHRTLLLAGACMAEGEIERMDVGIVAQSTYIREGAFQDRDVLAHLVLSNPTDAAAGFQVGFTFDVGFSDQGPAHGMRLTQTLRKMHNLIRDDVLPRFEPFLS